ncbi:MAG: winged helix-turn-helix domain-containing protein, partial [Plesiomonas sp.]
VCLANAYENEPRVTIDDSPSVFNYVEFGKVLIGAHHGHTAKAEKLAGVMAADMPEAWGRTKHRTWMTGHIHHASTKEYPGVYVESFATLAAKDAYAASGGWRSRRNTQCIVFHREFGEVERHTIDISMV